VPVVRNSSLDRQSWYSHSALADRSSAEEDTAVHSLKRVLDHGLLSAQSLLALAHIVELAEKDIDLAAKSLADTAMD